MPFHYKLDSAEARMALTIETMVSADRDEQMSLAGMRTPTLRELLARKHCRSGDVYQDAAFWAVSLLSQNQSSPTKLPRALATALGELAAKPNRQTLGRVLALTQKLRAEWSMGYRASIIAIRDRCTVYLAILGDSAAKRAQIELAFGAIDQRDMDPLSTEILLAAIGDSLGIDGRAMDKIVAGIERLGEIETVTRGDYKRWLDGYRVAVDAPADDFVEPVVIDGLDVEREQIADLLEERWGAGPARPTGLVVVPSLDHLPKPSLGARDRRDSPRAEFDEIAGKELPFKKIERDISEIADEMTRAFPWMSSVLDALLMDLASSPGQIAFPPTILAGPPGTGKTTGLIALCEAIGAPTTTYSAAGVSDGAFMGTSRQWSTGRSCVSLQAILRSRYANAVIIVDEAEKTGTGRRNGAFHDGLLTLTEAVSASRFFDQYLECAVDLSAVSYLATVNDLALLPGPLRDRFRVLQVPEPSREHVPVIVAGMLADMRKARGISQEFLPDLAPDEVGLIVDRWKPGSMRGLRRTVETLLAGRDRLATRN